MSGNKCLRQWNGSCAIYDGGKADFSKNTILFLLSMRGCGGVVAIVKGAVTGDLVGLTGGQAPLVNSMLSMAISLLQTPITASICS